VVPFAPGASTDTLARFEADVLQRALHQSFVVENRPLRAVQGRSD
jgi:tripartite-type tricarboxylate transporter receptor subunit TctC